MLRLPTTSETGPSATCLYLPLGRITESASIRTTHFKFTDGYNYLGTNAAYIRSEYENRLDTNAAHIRSEDENRPDTTD